jgi:hypothetical protein
MNSFVGSHLSAINERKFKRGKNGHYRTLASATCQRIYQSSNDEINWQRVCSKSEPSCPNLKAEMRISERNNVKCRLKFRSNEFRHRATLPTLACYGGGCCVASIGT